MNVINDVIIVGWLKFKRHMSAETGKTQKWFVKHKDSDDGLGYIKWNCGWRQYWFEPTSDTGFSKGCLRDIANFIHKLMDDRK